METMKIPKPFCMFAVFTCAAIYAIYTKWNFDYKRKSADKGLEKLLGAEASGKDEAVLYGIMFDAGSTGTRIHVFQFAQKPKGISAWITINFLTDSLDNPAKKCVGMLDLGGGSTQITFRPSTETSVENSTAEDITSFNLFNTTYKLNSHSYLGLGLMSARLAILGGVEGQALKEGEELTSPCLSLNYQGEWEHAKIQYKIKGQKTGRPLFESCHNEISKVLNKKIHETARIKDLDFYAFSYYYDLAVDAGLIDKEKGGILPVWKFESAARKVCKTMEIQQGKHPFLCMDLTYVSLLLKELGFSKNHILKLAQKINNIETSWALGAILHYIDSPHML